MTFYLFGAAALVLAVGYVCCCWLALYFGDEPLYEQKLRVLYPDEWAKRQEQKL